MLPTLTFAAGCWWVLGALVGSLVLAPAGLAQAQVAPRRTAPAAKQPAPLPPAQVEEALRMLLRADSTGRHRAQGPESSGLVLDQTITKLGRDFFDLFYTGFEAPPGIVDYTIILTERPIRAGQALVALTVNDVELLELPLSPQADQIAEAATQAVAVAQGLLLENQRVSRQLESGRRAPLETF